MSRTHRTPDRALRDGIAFALLPRIGCLAFREGVERHGSAADALSEAGTSAARAEALREADTIVAKAAALGVRVLLLGEPEYPDVLMELPDAPSILYALGDVRLIERQRVGIVGTRHSSPAGERFAHRMACALARAGVMVVSGMALGIDAAAHRGALDAGGGTIAVLGGGVDLPYPPTHAALHAHIVRDGLVLSEAPISARPVKGAFPRRNRIIAALSELLIVVEAGDRSGALITSRLALELGRTVAAVPGPLESPRHVGSNRLLSEGASFIASVDDMLSLAGVPSTGPKPQEIPSGEASQLVTEDPIEVKVLDAVRTGVSDVDQLANRTKLSPRQLATALSALEMQGRLSVTSSGVVVLGS